MSRPSPYELVFAGLAEERFPRIQAALQAAGRDPTDRDAFLMERDAVLLLRELRPDGGLGEGIDQLAAFLHHAYLFWDAGQPVVTLDDEDLAGVVGPADPVRSADGPRASYAAFPPRRIWAELTEGAPAEPLDGCFLHASGPDRLRVLGVFGLRPERLGFSVVEASGSPPVALARPDGSALFAPTLAGGRAAGLHSLAGAEELLELGWRTRRLASADPVGAGRWTR